MPLVLASTSPYRKAQLQRLGIDFRQASPSVDEGPLMISGKPARDIALALARAKATALAEPRDFVLGGDQLVCLDGKVLGKPGSVERAEAQLGELAGRTHELISAWALSSPEGSVDSGVHVHRMTMRALSAAEIRRYVQIDAPLDCCGTYKIESLGISLFDAVEGTDPSAIEGLPLMAVCSALRRAGFSIP